MGIYNSNCDFNKYKMFYAVSEYKSFSKAAEVLHISQPAISYAVKELERDLDTTLLIRERKNIRLTPEGQELIYYIEKIFSNVMKAERAMKERKNNEEDLYGEIRIGIYSHISLTLLPKLIKEFEKIHPKVNFNIYSTSQPEMVEKLKRRELDMLIVQFPVFIDNNNFQEEILCEFETCFYSGEEIYHQYINDKDSILNYPLMLPMRGFSDIDALEEKLKSKNTKLIKKYRVYTHELMKEMALDNIGIGWGIKKLLEKELNEKKLFVIPFDINSPTSKISVIYDTNCMNKASIEFLKFLFQHTEKKQ